MNPVSSRAKVPERTKPPKARGLPDLDHEARKLTCKAAASMSERNLSNEARVSPRRRCPAARASNEAPPPPRHDGPCPCRLHLQQYLHRVLAGKPERRRRKGAGQYLDAPQRRHQRRLRSRFPGVSRGFGLLFLEEFARCVPLSSLAWLLFACPFSLHSHSSLRPPRQVKPSLRDFTNGLR
jgi:hypothetical protein